MRSGSESAEGVLRLVFVPVVRFNRERLPSSNTLQCFASPFLTLTYNKLDSKSLPASRSTQHRRRTVNTNLIV